MRRWLLLSCTLVACAARESDGEQAVTNGTAATGDPAVAAIVDGSGTIGCTATVIAPHTAITAAHCFVSRNPRTLSLLFGASREQPTAITPISDARSHPSFDPSTLAHDVALMTFRTEAAATLALDPRTIDGTLVGTDVRVVGFGATSGTAGDAGTKREGIARISDVQADEFTAMPNPSQPCRGDSGGPVFLGSTVADVIAGVVSRGDAACVDHAVFSRIDVARSVLVDPYLADIAPGTAHTGDACFYEGHCAEGPCLQTHDDVSLYFCSKSCTRDSDCPDAMKCASDGCRYPTPSPGALGYACDQDVDCSSEMCRESVCTVMCLLDPAVCPSGFECRGAGPSSYCFAKPDDDCGSCTTGTGAPLWIVVIWFVRARRSGRSSSRRDSRAVRSR